LPILQEHPADSGPVVVEHYHDGSGCDRDRGYQGDGRGYGMSDAQGQQRDRQQDQPSDKSVRRLQCRKDCQCQDGYGKYLKRIEADEYCHVQQDGRGRKHEPGDDARKEPSPPYDPSHYQEHETDGRSERRQSRNRHAFTEYTEGDRDLLREKQGPVVLPISNDRAAFCEQAPGRQHMNSSS
jgi:hypothetical protein